MSDTPKQTDRGPKSRFLLTFLLHQFIGTFGVMILAGMLTAIVLEVPNPWGHHTIREVLAGAPYFPAQVAVALFFGWLLSDIFGHQSMLWIWVLPYACLIYDFARLPSVLGMRFGARLTYFFGWGCRPENHCLDQLGITLPFYTAVAYSLGSLVARKLPLRSPVARRKVSGVVLAVGILVLVDEAIAILFYLDKLLSLVPREWTWVLLLAFLLDTGIGASIIFLALKLRRIHTEPAPDELLGAS